MSLAWTAMYWADYDAKTEHLTLNEDGAYRRLLSTYYKTGKPIPANAEVLLRICRAFADDEKAAVLSVLSQFFVLEPDGYHNGRADEELSKRTQISEKRRDAGKKGADSTNSKSRELRAASAAANADTTTTTSTYINTNTPTPLKRKRRKSSEVIAGYAPAVGVVVNPLFEEWPRKQPKDGSAIHIALAETADRVAVILEDPNIQPEFLLQGARDYLQEKKNFFHAPQYFFGPGNGTGAPWKPYARMVYHRAHQTSTAGATA